MKKMVCLFYLLLAGMNLRAQQQLNLKAVVRLTQHEWPLDELLLKVTQQTGVRFSINTRKFPPSRKVYIKLLRQTVAELLAAINKTTGIAYTQTGVHIILMDAVKKPPVVPPKRSTVAAKPKPAKTQTVSRVQQLAADSIRSYATPATPQLLQLAVVPEDAVSATVAGLKPAQLRKLLLSKRPPKKENQSPNNQKNLKEEIASTPENSGNNSSTAAGGNGSTSSNNATTSNSKSKNASSEKHRGFFTSAGSSIDDALYLNNTLSAGHTYAYGIISWITDFRNSGFRYGLGTSLPLNERWALHLQYTTGKMTFGYDTAASLRKELKATWQQVALKGEWKITNKFRLQFGPVLHFLKADHTLNGSPAPIYASEDDLFPKYHLVKPRLMLSNNFNQ
jgi:hypothetical protein